MTTGTWVYLWPDPMETEPVSISERLIRSHGGTVIGFIWFVWGGDVILRMTRLAPVASPVVKKGPSIMTDNPLEL